MTINGINVINGASVHPAYTGLSLMQVPIANSYYKKVKGKPLEDLKDIVDSLAPEEGFFGAVEDIFENAFDGTRRPKFCAVIRAYNESQEKGN